MQPPKWWYDPSLPVPLPAKLLAAVYGAVTGLRRAMYRTMRPWQRKIPVPVIVVGNVIAGGSGKTPLTIALVKWLSNNGWKPGIASRGYGRKRSHVPRWVTAQTSPKDGGDEPVLMAWKTDALVFVDRQRDDAARVLYESGCTIIVCDDGLQHYLLARDIEIEVIDAQRRYGNGRLIPAGPLREPPERARQCDFHVLNLGSASSGTHLALPESNNEPWPMQLTITTAQSLSNQEERPLSDFAGKKVHAVAGIAYPQRFFDMLRQHDIELIEYPFTDHHFYRPADLQFNDDLPILMTEKDAVKCQHLAKPNHYAVPLQTTLPDTFWQALHTRLKSLKTTPS